MEIMERGEKKTTIYRKRLINDNLIIPHNLIKQILKKGGGNALQLYTFYLYTGNWQRTNKPEAVEKYCMEGLEMGRPNYLKAKKVLEDLKLIKLIKERKENNQFGKNLVLLLSHHYVGNYMTVINNDIQDNNGNNLICTKCGTPDFITTMQKTTMQETAYKDREIKNSKNMGSPKDSPIKKECPFKHIFGSDYNKKVECSICNEKDEYSKINRNCKHEWYNLQPKIIYVKGECPHKHRFGIDTEKFPECDLCENWNDCADKKEGKTNITK